MKKCLLILLALMFLLCSCAKGQEAEKELEMPTIIDEVALKEEMAGTIELKLYFLSLDSTSLLSETREVPVKQGENLALRAVKELINGSREFNRKRVAPIDTYVEDVFVCGKVATVFLKSDNKPDEKEQFCFEYAITNTLCDFLNVEYVNVLWNGNIYSQVATGMKSRFSGNIAQAYTEQVFSAAAMPAESVLEINIPLFFSCDEHKYLMAEERKVVITNSEYVEKIFDELKKGASAKNRSRELFKDDMMLSYYSFDKQGEKIYLNLRISEMDHIIYNSKDIMKMFASQLTATYQSILPNIDGIIISADERSEWTNTPLSIEAFLDIMGADINVYMQNAKNDTLTAVSRNCWCKRCMGS